MLSLTIIFFLLYTIIPCLFNEWMSIGKQLPGRARCSAFPGVANVIFHSCTVPSCYWKIISLFEAAIANKTEMFHGRRKHIIISSGSSRESKCEVFIINGYYYNKIPVIKTSNWFHKNSKGNWIRWWFEREMGRYEFSLRISSLFLEPPLDICFAFYCLP